MSQMISIHSTHEAATLSCKLGEVPILAKWKQTANQTSKQRGICIPMECVKAPEVPESFRALVESVLASTAVETLKRFVDQNGESWEVSSELFARTNLVQAAMESGSNWMSKQELELSFTVSATWKRITNRVEWTQGNAVYKATAEGFKDRILKLSGKATRFDAQTCDALLSTLSDEDLQSPFGEFVATRLAQIKKQETAELDLSIL